MESRTLLTFGMVTCPPPSSPVPRHGGRSTSANAVLDAEALSMHNMHNLNEAMSVRRLLCSRSVSRRKNGSVKCETGDSTRIVKRNPYRTSQVYVNFLSVRSYTTSSQRATPYLIESNLRLSASLRRFSDVNALKTSWMNEAMRGGRSKFCAVTELTARRGCWLAVVHSPHSYR